MPEILDEVEEFLKKFQEQQSAQKSEMLRSVLESDPGQRFLQGADNLFAGTQALNSLGRAAPDLFSRALGAMPNTAPISFLSDPGQDEGLEGLMKFFNPFRGITPLPRGFPFNNSRGDVPIPMPTPRPGLPTVGVGQGFPHGEGQIPDGSHMLFSGGVMGRNEKEGRIKDMKRDMKIKKDLEDIYQKLKEQGPTPGNRVRPQ
jgi:hypothetical protein